MIYLTVLKARFVPIVLYPTPRLCHRSVCYCCYISVCYKLTVQTVLITVALKLCLNCNNNCKQTRYYFKMKSTILVKNTII